MAKRKRIRGAASPAAPPIQTIASADAPVAWPRAASWNLLLLATVSAIFFRQLFLHPDEMLWGSDIERVFAPFRHIQHWSFAELGRFPLWDPTILCGRSIVGDSTHLMLSPFAWLFWVTSSPLMFGLYFWLYVTLGAWGVFLWLRNTGVAPVGAFLAAVGFAYSGKTAAHLFAGHMDVLPTMMGAPWLFWAAERVLLYRTRGSAVVLGATLSLTATAGHLPSIYWNVFFVAVYLIIQGILLGRSARWSAVRRCAGLLLLAGVVFLVGAMAWWLPIARQTLLLSARAQTTGDDYGFATMFSAAPSDLLRMLWPFHGLPVPKPFASDSENTFFWETASYPGLLILAGACFCILVAPRRKETRIFGGLGVLAVVLALGPNTPVHQLFYSIVPGISLTRDPGRLFLYSNLFLGALAGLGFAELLRIEPRRRWTFVGIVGVLLLITLMRPAAHRPAAGGVVGSPMFSISVLTLFALGGVLFALGGLSVRGFAGLAMATGILDLGLVWTAHVYTAPPTFAPRANSVAEFLAREMASQGPFRYFDPTETVPQQLAARYGLQTITGYHPGIYQHQLESYRALWPEGERSDVVQLFMHSPKDIVCTPLLDLMNARYVVAYEDELDDRFVKVFTTPDGEFEPPRSVFERKDWLSRAFVVPASLPAAGDDGARAVCRIDPRAECIVDDVSVAGGGTFRTVELASWQPGEIAFDCQVEAAGVLVLSESWHPDWVATDNGEPVSVHRANFGFLGLPLGPGAHDVRLWYRPWDFYLGCLVSSLTWLGLALLAVARRRTKPDSMPIW